MIVRAYQPLDQDQVIELWRAADLITPQNNAVDDIQRKLKIDADLFLVGTVKHEVIATVMGGYEGHRGWINYLAVKPSMQRQGYGRLLMRAVEALLQGKGCPKINLQIRNGNSAVINFYAAIGYTDDRVIGLGKRMSSDD